MLNIKKHTILMLGFLVLCADALTKSLALHYLPYGEAVPVFPLFNLSLRFNTGVAFSLLANGSAYMPWLITAIALCVITIFVRWYVKVDQERVAERTGLILIIAGALGNVIDRFYYGHVIDFIEVYYGQYFWPAFNIADAAISVGAGFVILSMLRGSHATR